MKKTGALLFVMLSAPLFSQSFYKGALVSDINLGVDIYSVQYHYQLKNSTLSTDKKSGAASSNFNLGLEYGVTNWLGIGLRGKFDNYYAKYDSTTRSKPTVKGAEISLLVNAHVIRSKHFDLPIGIDLGYSHLNFFQNDLANNQIYGNGSIFNLHLNPRVYFGRFGFNLNMAFPFITYKNMTSNNATFNQYVLANWKASGFSLGFGLQYRFLRAK